MNILVDEQVKLANEVISVSWMASTTKHKFVD